jgi:hypothetical protein
LNSLKKFSTITKNYTAAHYHQSAQTPFPTKKKTPYIWTKISKLQTFFAGKSVVFTITNSIFYCHDLGVVTIDGVWIGKWIY